jgi:transcriptional regulator with XRE-family HTH domain
MSIGEKLARRRHALGLSIDDIAATTGMSARHVSAIESSAEQFAAPVDMSRMIRLYARKVGLSVGAEGLGAKSRSEAPAGIAPPPIPHFLLKPAPSRAE